MPYRLQPRLHKLNTSSHETLTRPVHGNSHHVCREQGERSIWNLLGMALRSIARTVRSKLPKGVRSVLLLDPSPSATPPLDLLRLSTCLRESGYDVSLHRGAAANANMLPDVAIVTGVFSWDLPAVRRELGWIADNWDCERYLTGVLARREGPPLADSLGALMLATGSMEARLDELTPDYSLVPDWLCSILITSKFEYRPSAGLAICPRACEVRC